jgi:Protein of unknown function (DUF4232)
MRIRQTVLRPGAGVVPMTGEHAVLYGLTNRGSVPCTLDGYPAVVLSSASGAVEVSPIEPTRQAATELHSRAAS